MATKTTEHAGLEDLMDRLREAGTEAGDRLSGLLEEAQVKRRVVAVADKIEDLRLELVRRLRGERATVPLEEMTVDQLHRLAAERNIKGRSTMNKAQLIDALRKD